MIIYFLLFGDKLLLILLFKYKLKLIIFICNIIKKEEF